MSDNASVWQKFFREWPRDLPQHGVIVTSFGEQVSFVGFMMTQDLLLLDRHAPDSVGARKIILPLSQIDALKIIDPVGGEVFQSSGFQGSLPKK